MSGNPKIHHCLKVNILAKRWGNLLPIGFSGKI
jgi:hypothetical protein